MQRRRTRPPRMTQVTEVFFFRREGDCVTRISGWRQGPLTGHP